jgi:hypothetical protein
MKSALSALLRRSLRQANQWLLNTPERALDEAYEAVCKIRRMEDNHFNGDRIVLDGSSYGESTRAYFRSELKKNLETARLRLAEFRTSNSIVRLSNGQRLEVDLDDQSGEASAVNIIDKPALIFRKLQLIDEVLDRYSPQRYSPPRSPLVVTAADPEALRPGPPTPRPAKSQEDAASFADKTGVLPRSILRTVDRIRRELDPKAEEQVVETFRDSKVRTFVSLRFVLILVIAPLLTQQVSKNFVVGPIVDHVRHEETATIFLNSEMEEEALRELQRYEERLRFQMFIGQAPELSDEDMEAHLKEKAAEIQDEFYVRSSDSIKNIFADFLSVIVFATVLVRSKAEISILKSFIDELVYGLSDSAKAFIIILFTDTFVGFHSPHGWEIILEGISRHFGLPASRDFIFLFIATFPVILDTVFKYWIFRYLNRISPSAVATYKNMNE